MAKWRVGIDVGGTFTDVVAYSSSGGQLYVDKVSSTPQNPADGVLNGLSRLIEHLKGDEVEFLSHGTTVAVNAIIQGKGAKVGVLITDGFRDLLEIQRQIVVRSETPAEEMLESFHQCGSYGVTKTMTHIVHYERGTLAIDVTEGHDRQLVWRGQLKGRVRGRFERHAEASVAEIMEHFPPRTAGD